ncbi:MAG: thiamine phosphate synthase [Planctomycetota bacterium]
MHPIGRMIDANANRAAEAARTLEDVARFALDHRDAAASCKAIRHRLESVLIASGFPRETRAAARDTTGDTGVANSAADAHTRRDLQEVVSAAGSRLGEALRVIEECLKTVDPRQAANAERIRYDAYEAERTVSTMLRARVRSSRQWPLCVLITESLCTSLGWRQTAAVLLEAGVPCLQLREKSLTDRVLASRARDLVAMAKDHAADVIINDRADIAAISGAAGVHLGQQELDTADARAIVGERALVGRSCCTVDQALAAQNDGADYIGIGAMYPTETKARPSIMGPSLLREVVGDATAGRLPHLAIGGITAERCDELVAAGCRGVAVSSAVCSSPDPAATARVIMQHFAETETETENHPCQTASSSTHSPTA